MLEVSKAEERDAAQVSPLRYLIVWLVLCALAGLSIGLSRIHLGAWNLAIALAIAAAKATLVILFFMHLWEHRGASRLAMAIAFCFIAVLTTLTVADTLLRLPISNPPTSLQARPYMGARELPREGEPDLRPERQPIAP
jgi:cytochrome c oxidase subunit 4